MAAPRLVVELLIGKEDVTQLMAIAQSRTEPANPVERRTFCWLIGMARPSSRWDVCLAGIVTLSK